MKKPSSENTPQTGKRKLSSTAWKPGQSGNPGGRPKVPEEQKLARMQAQAILDAHTTEAAWLKVELLKSKDLKLADAAASSILDRASIRGVERLEVANTGSNETTESELAGLNDEELRVVQKMLAAARARAGAKVVPLVPKPKAKAR